VGLVLISASVRAAAVSLGICDIHVDRRLSVFQVVIDDQAYRAKGFLTYQDALALRDVLLSAGTCKSVAAPRLCEIKALAAFEFAIYRDGENFDRYAKLHTLEQAQAYAGALVKRKLCVMKE